MSGSWCSTALYNAVGVVVTYGHSSDNTASSTTVDATVPLQCGRWVTCLIRTIYCPFLSGWLCDSLLCCPPYTTVGANDALLYAVGCVTLCCDAPFHYYQGKCCPLFSGWLCDPLLCCPPTLLLEQPLPVLLPGRGSFSRPFTALPPPYTVPRFNAAFFSAMDMSVLSDP